jgi:hypothetical protein
MLSTRAGRRSRCERLAEVIGRDGVPVPMRSKLAPTDLKIFADCSAVSVTPSTFVVSRLIKRQWPASGK